MKYAIRFLSLIGVCLFLAACGQQVIQGNGNPTTQNPEVSVFNNIKLSGPFEVVITVSDTAQSLSVTADNNLQSYVNHNVENGILTINVKERYRLVPTQRIHIAIQTKQLDSLYVQDGTQVSVLGLQNDSFEINGGGDSRVSIAGKAEAASIALTNTSNLDARNFIIQDLTLDVSGNAQAQIYVTRKLIAKITGGNTTYYGNPQEVNRTITAGQFQPGVGSGDGSMAPQSAVQAPEGAVNGTTAPAPETASQPETPPSSPPAVQPEMPPSPPPAPPEGASSNQNVPNNMSSE